MIQETKLSPEEHKRAVIFARLVYVMVAVAFVSICTVAVLASMEMEKHRTGYKPITVKTPISFFDRSYMKEEPAVPTAQTEPTAKPEAH